MVARVIPPSTPNPTPFWFACCASAGVASISPAAAHRAVSVAVRNARMVPPSRDSIELHLPRYAVASCGASPLSTVTCQLSVATDRPDTGTSGARSNEFKDPRQQQRRDEKKEKRDERRPQRLVNGIPGECPIALVLG